MLKSKAFIQQREGDGERGWRERDGGREGARVRESEEDGERVRVGEREWEREKERHAAFIVHRANSSTWFLTY